MIEDLLRALLDPALLVDVLIILCFVGGVVALYVWFQRNQASQALLEVIKFGLWASTHQTVHAGNAEDYFDADLFLGQPKNIGLTIDWFKEEVQKQKRLSGRIDRLVFVEKDEGPVGALTLKDLLSWESKIPSAVVRPRRKGPAMKIKLIHPDAKSTSGTGYESIRQNFRANGDPERIVLVSDVATTGTTILHAVDLISSAGGRVDAAFVLYDREERIPHQGSTISATEKLQKHSVRLAAMLKANQMKVAIEKSKEIKEAARRKGVVSTTAN